MGLGQNLSKIAYCFLCELVQKGTSFIHLDTPILQGPYFCLWDKRGIKKLHSKFLILRLG